VPPPVIPALNPKQLAVASVSSVIGGLVGAAFGGSVVMTFVGLAVGPWLTAFVEHPGPHRRRRVALVALLALLVFACRKALASIRGRRTSATTAMGRQRRQVLRVAVTSAVGAVVAVFAVTAGEVAGGDSLVGKDRTTFFGGGTSRPHGPGVPNSPGTSGRGGGSSAGERGSRAPSLQVPDRIVVTAPDRRGRRVTYRAPAADATGNPLTPTCGPPSGTVFDLGSTAVRCTVTDARGKRTDGDFVVVVHQGPSPPAKDTKAPTLSVPDDLTRKTKSDGLNVTYLATASDDRDGPLAPSCRPASGDRFDLGRTRVACSATDAAGHTTRAGFTVTVVRAGTGQPADTTPPDIVIPDDIRLAATGPQGRQVGYRTAATDDRDGSLKPVCDPPPGSMFAVGTSSVRCTATNSAGLSTTRSFTVEVVDGPPVLRLSSPDPVLTTSDKGANVTFTADATDAVDGDLQPTCSPRSGSFFTLGEQTVKCTVKDSAGNIEEGTTTVRVTRQPDTTPPRILGKRTVRAPAPDGDPVEVTFKLVGRDDRDGRVPVTCSPESRSIFPIGTTRVVCTARDSAGNEAEVKVRVVVEDTRPT
jgi:hypothetical protein